jgi:hypothetical protein
MEHRRTREAPLKPRFVTMRTSTPGIDVGRVDRSTCMLKAFRAARCRDLERFAAERGSIYAGRTQRIVGGGHSPVVPAAAAVASIETARV